MKLNRISLLALDELAEEGFLTEGELYLWKKEEITSETLFQNKDKIDATLYQICKLNVNYIVLVMAIW